MSANSLALADMTLQCAPGPRVPVQRYTGAELARYDGTDPTLPVLIAYMGRVYDVTASFPWAKGSHWGGLRAGQDLTGRLKESIHGEEMLARIPCVGELVDG
jgi:predicted heme/steroid binding protein